MNVDNYAVKILPNGLISINLQIIVQRDAKNVNKFRII